MSKRLSIIWDFLSHYKYLIVIVIGVLTVGVLDENSFRKLIEYQLQIDDLQDQIDKYNKIYFKSSAQLRNLRNDSTSVGKIAREKYFMKADDEDVFVLSTDKPAEPQDNAFDVSDNTDNTDNETTE